jgi:hypothetical protein
MPPLLPRSMLRSLLSQHWLRQKKAEKDLANANKEHLQREQAMAERLNQMSAAAGGTYYTFFHFVSFLALLCLLMYSFSAVLLFPWFCTI